MHAWHLECHGDPAERVAPDAGAQQIIDAGRTWEQECFESLKDAIEVKWDGRDWNTGQAVTLALMNKGVPWIYQAVLKRDDVRGFPDLLQRVRGKSNLGGYAYEPVDIKSHKDVSAKDRVQLHVSSYLLEPILGALPRRAGVWLSTGKIQRIKISADDGLLTEMRQVRDAGASTEGVRCGECSICPWADHCWQRWQDSRHSTLIYGVTGRTARKLTAAALTTYDDVAKSTPAKLARTLEVERSKATRIHRAARAWSIGKPVIHSRARWPAGQAVHFYDIETLGETVYLHGLISLGTDGSSNEHQTLARDNKDERRSWHEFLDIVAVLPPGPVYAWSDYESGFVRALWKRHRGSARGYRRLTRDLVDMCALVREHYAIPSSSYSIKEVAPLFGFAWHADTPGGLAAGAWYTEWLKSSDHALLQKICEYNLDDVRAMVAVYKALRRLDR
jgi:uncharacterized protein